MSRLQLAAVVIVGLVLLAGCLDATVTTEVGADGDLDSMDVEMEIDPFVYSLLQDEAHEEGYESIEGMLEADAEADGLGDDVSASTEQLDDGNYLVTVSARNVDPAALDGVDVTLEDETIRYESTDVGGEGSFEDELEDPDPFDEQAASGSTVAIELLGTTATLEAADDEWDDDLEEWEEDGDDAFDDDVDEWEEDAFDDEWEDGDFEEEWDDEWEDEFDEEWEDEFDGLDPFGDVELQMEYVVVMPGEIQETNAHEISDDGTTATWTYEFDADADTFDEDETRYAESTIDEDDGIPGFGAGVAVLSVLAATLLAGLGFARD